MIVVFLLFRSAPSLVPPLPRSSSPIAASSKWPRASKRTHTYYINPRFVKHFTRNKTLKCFSYRSPLRGCRHYS